MSNQNNEPKKKITEFSEDSLKDIAKEIVVKRTALMIHIILYVSVNLLLVGINYGVNKFEGGISSAWALWPITGWAIGLFIHLLYYMIFKKGIVNYITIAAIYHLGIYIILSAFLIFVDWYTTFTLDWFYWAIGPWGVALIIHLLFLFYFLPKRNVANENLPAEQQTWMNRKVTKELDKINKNTNK